MSAFYQFSGTRYSVKFLSIPCHRCGFHLSKCRVLERTFLRRIDHKECNIIFREYNVHLYIDSSVLLEDSLALLKQLRLQKDVQIYKKTNVLFFKLVLALLAKALLQYSTKRVESSRKKETTTHWNEGFLPVIAKMQRCLPNPESEICSVPSKNGTSLLKMSLLDGSHVSR